mmetsp:Transcript_6279/g.12944  ORF Transcript_6279/g.12944 Transcript_6279/m.12944 type:complete len:100 (-) Transcript_6279:826-1125(-)
MTSLDCIAFEQTSGAVMKFMEMKAIFPFDPSLAASFNSRILNSSGTTVHGSCMQAKRTSFSKRRAPASLGASLFSRDCFGKTGITRHMSKFVSSYDDIS